MEDHSVFHNYTPIYIYIHLIIVHDKPNLPKSFAVLPKHAAWELIITGIWYFLAKDINLAT